MVRGAAVARPPLVMSLLNKLERQFGRFAIPNLSLLIVAGQVLAWGLYLMAGVNIERIALLPAAVRGGEVWRVVTFVFFPPTLSINALALTFMAFGWYLFFLMGSALEHYWGTFRYNVFLGIGWCFTVAAACLTPAAYATNYFFLLSVFLAFAYLNPDFEIYVLFILPVKIKWLALFQWFGYALLLAVGDWTIRLGVLAATANFLVFFAGDLVAQLRTGRRRMAHQARVAAARVDETEARHVCRVCGRSDQSDPKLDFRYCSKCAGDECYCPEHIANHEHVTAAPKA